MYIHICICIYIYKYTHKYLKIPKSWKSPCFLGVVPCQAAESAQALSLAQAVQRIPTRVREALVWAAVLPLSFPCQGGGLQKRLCFQLFLHGKYHENDHICVFSKINFFGPGGDLGVSIVMKITPR